MRMANMTETSHLVGTCAVSGPRIPTATGWARYISKGPGIYRQIGEARRGNSEAIENRGAREKEQRLQRSRNKSVSEIDTNRSSDGRARNLPNNTRVCRYLLSYDTRQCHYRITCPPRRFAYFSCNLTKFSRIKRYCP
jgi:hypothetical protein